MSGGELEGVIPMFGCSLLLLSPSFFILLHSIKILVVGGVVGPTPSHLTSYYDDLITINYEYFTPGVSCRPPCWWRFGRSGAPLCLMH